MVGFVLVAIAVVVGGGIIADFCTQRLEQISGNARRIGLIAAFVLLVVGVAMQFPKERPVPAMNEADASTSDTSLYSHSSAAEALGCRSAEPEASIEGSLGVASITRGDTEWSQQVEINQGDTISFQAHVRNLEGSNHLSNIRARLLVQDDRTSDPVAVLQACGSNTGLITDTVMLKTSNPASLVFVPGSVTIKTSDGNLRTGSDGFVSNAGESLGALSAAAGIDELTVKVDADVLSPDDLVDIAAPGAGGGPAERKCGTVARNQTAGPTWGPERAMFTTASPAPYATLNSISDTDFGDERTFFDVKSSKHMTTGGFCGGLQVADGDVLLFRAHVSNSAADDLAGTTVGTAVDTKIEIHTDASIASLTRVTAELTSPSTKPTAVVSIVELSAEHPFRLDPIAGSSTMYTNSNPEGTDIEDPWRSPALLGDGRIEPGNRYNAVVTSRARVTFVR